MEITLFNDPSQDPTVKIANSIDQFNKITLKSIKKQPSAPLLDKILKFATQKNLTKQLKKDKDTKNLYKCILAMQYKVIQQSKLQENNAEKIERLEFRKQTLEIKSINLKQQTKKKKTLKYMKSRQNICLFDSLRKQEQLMESCGFISDAQSQQFCQMMDDSKVEHNLKTISTIAKSSQKLLKPVKLSMNFTPLYKEKQKQKNKVNKLLDSAQLNTQISCRPISQLVKCKSEKVLKTSSQHIKCHLKAANSSEIKVKTQ